MSLARAVYTLTVAGGILHAQSQAGAAAGPTFEAASVKGSSPNNNAPPGVRFSPNSLTYTGMTLRILLRTAYGVQNSQKTGGPPWLDSSRFDIAAKAEGNPAPLEIIGMLRTLLDDRFKLRAHRETRVLPLFELIVASGGRQYGPGLKRATEAACHSDPGATWVEMLVIDHAEKPSEN